MSCDFISLNKPHGHSLPLKITAIVVTLLTIVSLTTPVSTLALTPEQKRVLDSGIYYFNTEENADPCTLVGSGGAVNVVVDRNFTLGTDPMERRINLMRALISDYGLTPEQAAGPVGNFMWESGGHHLPPDVNEGQTNGPPRFSGGYGWAQWTGGRQRAFIDFAIENGYMVSESEHATDAANYAFLKYELNGSYAQTIEELRNQTTPEDAVISFEDTYERAGIPRIEQRTPLGRQVFVEYLGSSPRGSLGSCGGTGNAAIVGEHAFPLITTKGGIENPGIFANGTTGQGGHPYTAYDILVPPGTPVAAFLSGTVTRITQDRCPGRMISIYNEESDLTISYLHLDFNNHVAQGERVSAGQQIGIIGPAVNGCGIPHLHIDAAQGSSRPACSRNSCPTASQAMFVDIGPQLYLTYQALLN